MEDNDKSILAILGLFLGGVFCGYLIEDFYRQFVRFVFWIFNGNHIQFTGKNFHLFASNPFVFAFAIFIVVVFLFLTYSNSKDALRKVRHAVLIFFVTTILIAGLDSKGMVLECTACDFGILELHYNRIAYDFYFLTSIFSSILFIVINWFFSMRAISVKNR